MSESFASNNNMNALSTTSSTPLSGDLPAHTVYLRHGEPLPLSAAVEMISASEDRQFVALCISHYSGYVREAAIARAIDLGGSFCLELIIERVNDWVPQVRKIARQGVSVSALLGTVPSEHFVSLFPKSSQPRSGYTHGPSFLAGHQGLKNDPSGASGPGEVENWSRFLSVAYILFN